MNSTELSIIRSVRPRGSVGRAMGGVARARRFAYSVAVLEAQGRSYLPQMAAEAGETKQLEGPQSEAA